MTIVDTRPITGGVDTHLDTHVAAALDANGGVLGVESFPTTPAGYQDLHAWLAGFGQLGIGWTLEALDPQRERMPDEQQLHRLSC